ncbi:hypothetical protein L484_015584 [Morus notabilis]|uniref:Uncharacterized protein n=1 Tax=Morus notabilis TaxID=981085 RepID=W9SAX8_9ROSA|nr:hypothetical protein L484_015584 [Morus notabilis]
MKTSPKNTFTGATVKRTSLDLKIPLLGSEIRWPTMRPQGIPAPWGQEKERRRGKDPVERKPEKKRQHKITKF